MDVDLEIGRIELPTFRTTGEFFILLQSGHSTTELNPLGHVHVWGSEKECYNL